MEDVIDLIKSRRNIKEFLPKHVAWEKIARVLDAGRHAPSCGNIQNWRFIVIFEPDQKKLISEICYEQYEIMHAAVLIVVVGDPVKAERYYGERGASLYTIQNCAAAIQNMLIEAHSLGLGTRWIGAFNEDELKEMLKIPEEIVPQAVIALGYAKEIPPRPPKFPLESLTFFSEWRLRLRDPAHYMGVTAAIFARKGKAITESVKKAGKFVVDKTVETSKNLREKDED